MARKHNKKKTDDGQVWSSYSDLFTTVAIIFLTMFVFAMIKVGVTTMEKMAQKKAHEKELEGIIPKKQIEINKKKEQRIKDSISKVSQYKDVINGKILELNSMVKDLASNEEVMNDLLKDRQKKEALLQKLKEDLSRKKREVALSISSNKELSKKLKNTQTKISKKDRSLEEVNKKILQKSSELQKMSEILKDEKQKSNQLEKDLKFKVKDLKSKNKNLIKKADAEVTKLVNQLASNTAKYENEIQSISQKNIKSLQTIKESKQRTISQIESAFKRELSKLEKSYKTQVESLKVQNSSLTKSNKEISKMFAKEQSKSNSLKDKLQNTQNELTQSEKKNKAHAQSNKSLKESLSRASEELDKNKSLNQMLGQEVNDLQNELASKGHGNNELNSQYASLQDYTNKLEGDLRGLESKLGKSESKLSSLEQGKKRALDANQSLKNKISQISEKVKGEKEKLRASIASKLSKKFRDSNIDATVDPKTGTVTLLMDNNLLFETNSAKLNDYAKEKLTQIIPLYSEVLFDDGKSRDKISSFNIEGHSSPSFNQSYVDPLEKNTQAYVYNLNLSARRATSITSYIFGHKIGDYNHKIYMRSISKSIGHGYMHPIEKEEQYRGLASLGTCGPYSCELSQRVELSFTLKEDPKVIENILSIGGGDL